jgi:hypothetical protein
LTRGAFEKAGKWLDEYKSTIALIVSAVGLAVIKDLSEATLNTKLSTPWRAGSGLEPVRELG